MTWNARTLMALDSAPLPGRLAQLLRQAQAAESVAAGPERRIAWRTTRQVLGAVLEAGYPTAAVADCLGISAGEVRARATADGWLAEATIVELAELTSAAILAWHQRGDLPVRRRGPGDQLHYPAIDLVRLLATPQLNPAAPRRRGWPGSAELSGD